MKWLKQNRKKEGEIFHFFKQYLFFSFLILTFISCSRKPNQNVSLDLQRSPQESLILGKSVFEEQEVSAFEFQLVKEENKNLWNPIRKYTYKVENCLTLSEKDQTSYKVSDFEIFRVVDSEISENFETALEVKNIEVKKIGNKICLSWEEEFHYSSVLYSVYSIDENTHTLYKININRAIVYKSSNQLNQGSIGNQNEQKVFFSYNVDLLILLGGNLIEDKTLYVTVEEEQYLRDLEESIKSGENYLNAVQPENKKNHLKLNPHSDYFVVEIYKTNQDQIGQYPPPYGYPLNFGVYSLETSALDIRSQKVCPLKGSELKEGEEDTCALRFNLSQFRQEIALSESVVNAINPGDSVEFSVKKLLPLSYKGNGRYDDINNYEFIGGSETPEVNVFDQGFILTKDAQGNISIAPLQTSSDVVTVSNLNNSIDMTTALDLSGSDMESDPDRENGGISGTSVDPGLNVQKVNIQDIEKLNLKLGVEDIKFYTNSYNGLPYSVEVENEIKIGDVFYKENGNDSWLKFPIGDAKYCLRLGNFSYLMNTNKTQIVEENVNAQTKWRVHEDNEFDRFSSHIDIRYKEFIHINGYTVNIVEREYESAALEGGILSDGTPIHNPIEFKRWEGDRQETEIKLTFNDIRIPQGRFILFLQLANGECADDQLENKSYKTYWKFVDYLGEVKKEYPLEFNVVDETQCLFDIAGIEKDQQPPCTHLTMSEMLKREKELKNMRDLEIAFNSIHYGFLSKNFLESQGLKYVTVSGSNVNADMEVKSFSEHFLTKDLTGNQYIHFENEQNVEKISQGNMDEIKEGIIVKSSDLSKLSGLTQFVENDPIKDIKSICGLLYDSLINNLDTQLGSEFPNLTFDEMLNKGTFVTACGKIYYESDNIFHRLNHWISESWFKINVPKELSDSSLLYLDCIMPDFFDLEQSGFNEDLFSNEFHYSQIEKFPLTTSACDRLFIHRKLTLPFQFEKKVLFQEGESKRLELEVVRNSQEEIFDNGTTKELRWMNFELRPKNLSKECQIFKINPVFLTPFLLRELEEFNSSDRGKEQERNKFMGELNNKSQGAVATHQKLNLVKWVVNNSGFLYCDDPSTEDHLVDQFIFIPKNLDSESTNFEITNITKNTINFDGYTDTFYLLQMISGLYRPGIDSEEFKSELLTYFIGSYYKVELNKMTPEQFDVFLHQDNTEWRDYLNDYYKPFLIYHKFIRRANRAVGMLGSPFSVDDLKGAFPLTIQR